MGFPRLVVFRLRVETLEGLKSLHWVMTRNFVNEIIEKFRMHCLVVKIRALMEIKSCPEETGDVRFCLPVS